MAGRPQIILDARHSQPSHYPLIAENDLTVGLVDAWLPNLWTRIGCDGPRVIARERMLHNGTLSVSTESSRFGVSRLSSSTGAWIREGSPLPSGDECTLLVVVRAVSTSGSTFHYGFGWSGGTTPVVAIGTGTGSVAQFWFRNDAGTTSHATSASAISTSAPTTLVGVRSVGNNHTSLYRNGALDASTTAGATGALSLDRSALNAIYRTAVGANANAHYYVALAWKRALSSGEIARVSADPYQVFAQPSARIFQFAPAAGGAFKASWAIAARGQLIGAGRGH